MTWEGLEKMTWEGFNKYLTYFSHKEELIVEVLEDSYGSTSPQIKKLLEKQVMSNVIAIIAVLVLLLLISCRVINH